VIRSTGREEEVRSVNCGGEWKDEADGRGSDPSITVRIYSVFQMDITRNGIDT
jgi:hypothetical protein